MDMTVAREMLAQLECAPEHQLLWPTMDECGDCSAEEFVTRATSLVWQDPLQADEPGGVWAAQQEACRMGGQCSELAHAQLEEMQLQLLSAATTNANAVQRKQAGCSEPQSTASEAQPRFLRVAQRMHRWREEQAAEVCMKKYRQTTIEWRRERARRGACRYCHGKTAAVWDRLIADRQVS